MMRFRKPRGLKCLIGSVGLVSLFGFFSGLQGTIYVWTQVEDIPKEGTILPAKTTLSSLEDTSILFPTHNNKSNQTSYPVLRKADFVYRFNNNRDSAPIVIETFSKVACTMQKQLFCRIHRYSNNWKAQGDRSFQPHNPKWNGLKYLRDYYSLKEVTHILTSPEWIHTLFLWDPKERFLSAFLDYKGMSNCGIYQGRFVLTTIWCNMRLSKKRRRAHDWAHES
jgi:hypothetical protein